MPLTIFNQWRESRTRSKRPHRPLFTYDISPPLVFLNLFPSVALSIKSKFLLVYRYGQIIGNSCRENAEVTGNSTILWKQELRIFLKKEFGTTKFAKFNKIVFIP